MKLNLRLVPVHELPLQGHSAFWYETSRDSDDALHDFHLTLYRDEAITAWLTLCPTADPDALQICNRYMSEENECNMMEEKALEYVENWARSRGYTCVFVNATAASIPFYLHMGYEQDGEPFSEESVLLCRMVKSL